MTTVAPPRPKLMPRELFVLQQLAAGLTVAEIQPLLTEPPKRGSTADAPGRGAAQKAVERLRVKLGARTHGQIVHTAWALGLLDARTVPPATAPPPDPAEDDDVRRCEWCGKPMPLGTRIDRRTDSDKCRRALARAESAAKQQ